MTSLRGDIELARPRRRGARALLEAMRPTHWVKNTFVIAPVLFAHKYTELTAWAQCLWAAAAFCLLSSGIYLLNDVNDRKVDRAHPVKRYRAVPSGRLGANVAFLAGVGLLIVGVAMAAAGRFLSGGEIMGGLGLLMWACAYVIITLLYTYRLKKHPIVDVIVIALGFVLRAMAGAAAIDVPASPWLVVCTFTLCLYIALAKRRSEVSSLADAAASRGANAGYDMADLNVMIAVASAMAIITYALYCLAPQTVDKTVGSANMVWTIPLVVYGIFRFNRLTSVSGRDPVAVLVRDRAMWAVMILYIVMAVLVIQFGRDDPFRNILAVYQPSP